MILLTLVQALIAALLPAIAAFITFQLIKKYALPWLDKQSSVVQQLIVGSEGVLFAKAGALLGLTLPATLQGFDANNVQAILNGLAAVALHKLFKQATTPASPGA